MRRYHKYGFEDFRGPHTGPHGHKPPEAKKLPTFTKFIIALLISVLAHILFVFTIPSLVQVKLPTQSHKKITKIKFKQELEESPKQVVALAPDQKQERPEKADYLANYNQKTKKQTQAKVTSLNPKKPTMQPQKTASNKVKPTPPKFPKPKTQKQESQLSLDDILTTPKPKNTDPLGINNFTKNLENFESATFSDHLKGLKKGDETNLNAWQWRHAPFFNRIKASIARVWAPLQQITRYDPQGALLGQKDRVTLLAVTLDRSGQIVKLSVAQNSGVAYLDEEARRAFYKAAPFPFPPKELFKDQEYFLFKFAFHLEVTRGFSFDFDWQEN